MAARHASRSASKWARSPSSYACSSSSNAASSASSRARYFSRKFSSIASLSVISAFPRSGPSSDEASPEPTLLLMSPSQPKALDAAAVAGLLAEDDRLKVVAALVLGAGTSNDVADVTGLEQRRVVQALERLAGAGLVVADNDGKSLRVRTEVFK